MAGEGGRRHSRGWVSFDGQEPEQPGTSPRSGADGGPSLWMNFSDGWAVQAQPGAGNPFANDAANFTAHTGNPFVGEPGVAKAQQGHLGAPASAFYSGSEPIQTHTFDPLAQSFEGEKQQQREQQEQPASSHPSPRQPPASSFNGAAAPSPPAWQAVHNPATAPPPSLPPTVAAAAAAAAATAAASSAGGAPPNASDARSRLMDVAAQSQGLHQNLDQLLKDSHQGLEGPGWAQSEEAAELARIRRIRESWKGLVAPKAQRCSRDGVDAVAGDGTGALHASLRERAIPPNSRPRTSLELRMAAAEALHVARRASPATEALFGVEEHLLQDRPPSAPMGALRLFPSPGPCDSQQGRQQQSASVPASHSPKLSFLGGTEQQPGPHRPGPRRSHEHPEAQPQPQGGGLMAPQGSGSPGGADQGGVMGERLRAYDAGESVLELRMAAAEAMAVTQRAAWEQQQQQRQQHDARLERELSERLLLQGDVVEERPPWRPNTPPQATSSSSSSSSSAAAAAAAAAASQPIAVPVPPPAAPTPAAPSPPTPKQRAPPPVPTRAAPPPPQPTSASQPPQSQAPPPAPAPALLAHAPHSHPAAAPARPAPPPPIQMAPPPCPAAPAGAPPPYEQALLYESAAPLAAPGPQVTGPQALPPPMGPALGSFHHRAAPPPPAPSTAPTTILPPLSTPQPLASVAPWPMPAAAAAAPAAEQPLPHHVRWQGLQGGGQATAAAPRRAAPPVPAPLQVQYQPPQPLPPAYQQASSLTPPSPQDVPASPPAPLARLPRRAAPPPPGAAAVPSLSSPTSPTSTAGSMPTLQPLQLPPNPFAPSPANAAAAASPPGVWPKQGSVCLSPGEPTSPPAGAGAGAGSGALAAVASSHFRPRAAQERQAAKQERKEQKQQLLPPQELSSQFKYSPSHPSAPLPLQPEPAPSARHPSFAPPNRPPPPIPTQQPLRDGLSKLPAHDRPDLLARQPPIAGLSSSQPPYGAPARTYSRSMSVGSLSAHSRSPSGQGKGVLDTGAQGAPLYADPAHSCKDVLCVEVRLPPLNLNKDTVESKLLATGLGNLFCMPAAGAPGHAMLNWAEVHGHLGLPHGHIHGAQEDADSTPCAAVPSPDPACDVATSVEVDELASTMWTGHKSGRVCKWSIGQSRGARCDQVWLAHRDHKVQALATTPWGELWTGSTYGTIRVWAYTPQGYNIRTPGKVSDVQRLNGDRPHSQLYALACATSGAIMWSLGRGAILLWDTYTGANLGALRVSSDGPVGMDLEARMHWIDPAKGLDPSATRRSFRMRVPPKGPGVDLDSSGDDEDAGGGGGGLHDAMKGDRSVAWGAKLTKGVGHVSKFAARMGKRTTQLAASVPQRLGRHVRTRSNGEPYVLEGGDPLGTETSGGSSTTTNNNNQRSRAEEVVLDKGDKGKGCALLATLDGHMLVAYKSGLVEKYTELGKRVWAARATTQVHLHSALLVGRFLWLGCSDGCLRLVDSGSGRAHMCWRAHMVPVRSLAAMGTTVYSLGRDGSIRGWPAVQPPPPALLEAWKEGARVSLRRHPLRMVVGTWNANSMRPSMRSMYQWLGCHVDEGVDLVCVGLQEMEMGTGSVATDAVRSIINRAALERGNVNAQWWSEQLLAMLGGPDAFTRVALRQMSGILMIAFCRNALAPHVGEVATSSVACGLMGVAGNKGAAAISLSLFRRRLIFLSSHFAAHLEKLEERNADYAKIVRCLRFDNTSATPPSSPRVGAAGQAASMGAEEDPCQLESGEACPSGADGQQGPGLRDAEVLVWVGDFNYRLSATYEWTVSRAEAGALGELLAVDQLRQEMGRGAIFHGLSEGPLLFPPTYKFDKGVPSSELRPLPYDSSDKKRVPAWTDRILWRGSLPPLPGSRATSAHEEDIIVSLSPESPTDASSSPLAGTGAAAAFSSSTSGSGAQPAVGLQAKGLAYGTALGVCDSDHKPVWCKLQLQLPAYVQQQKRRMSEQVLHDVRREVSPRSPPRLTLHIESLQPTMSHQVPDNVPSLALRRDEVEEVVVRNPGPAPVLMRVVGGEGKPVPLWLEVRPASGLVPPRGSVRFTLQAAAPDGTCQGLGGGAAALRAQEVILHVCGQHLTALGRGPEHAASQQYNNPLQPASVPQPLQLRVQSLFY